jgi:hypothetical protein
MTLPWWELLFGEATASLFEFSPVAALAAQKNEQESKFPSYLGKAVLLRKAGTDGQDTTD